MHFLLTTLQVAYVLTSDPPQEHDTETVEHIRRCQKWENDDYICRGHILNSMRDSLFDIYQTMPYAKELWNLLETRYMKEDATSKKFLVSQFNTYQMREDRSIMEQFNELERILGHFKMHNMNMDETIIVSSIIDNLLSS